jgi:hypothetical protein
MKRIPKDKTHRRLNVIQMKPGKMKRNKPKEDKVIPDPIDDRKFQE